MKSLTRWTSGLARMATAALVVTLAMPAWTEFDLQGHRGCRGLRPENTLPAFEHALTLGVTTLEFDLQVTRDREVIVYHDQKLNGHHCRRDDGGNVPGLAFKDLDFAQLEGIDCGSLTNRHYPEQQASPGARIPTFTEVLRLARNAPYPVQVSVEIKLQDRESGIPVEEFADLVVDRLRAEGMESRAIVQSFDSEALAAIAALAPELPRAALVRKPGRYDRALEAGSATILSPKHGALRQEHVDRMHARGVPVIPWTVNEPKDIRRILSLGVDGIISDYPDRVLAIRAERNEADRPDTRGCVGAPSGR